MNNKHSSLIKPLQLQQLFPPKSLYMLLILQASISFSSLVFLMVDPMDTSCPKTHTQERPKRIKNRVRDKVPTSGRKSLLRPVRTVAAATELGGLHSRLSIFSGSLRGEVTRQKSRSGQAEGPAVQASLAWLAPRLTVCFGNSMPLLCHQEVGQ